MLKVALVFPRFKYASGDPPLGLAYIAAYLRAQNLAEISIIDTTFNPSMDFVWSSLARLEPDIVGVYVNTIMFKDAVRVAMIAKARGALVVAGGPHATVAPDSLYRKVDRIVCGEGEYALASIVKDENYGKNVPWITSSRPQNLDTLPFPALDLVDIEKYIEAWHYLDVIDMNRRGTDIITHRGCPWDCTYCQPTLKKLFGDKVRKRSPQNVVAEIKELNNKYGINAIFFHDDTFTYDRKWIFEFCDLLEKERLHLLWACNARADTIDDVLIGRMSEVGLRKIHLGIESSSDRILKEIYNKGITQTDVRNAILAAKKNKVKVMGFFMFGAPTETRQEIEQTRKFAQSLGIDEMSVSITSPLPGTHLYDMVAERYQLSDNFDDYDYYSKRAFDGELSLKELKWLQRKVLFMFYIHPKRWGYIWHHISSIKGIKRMVGKLKRFR